MLTFFHGWRRKMGVATLVMALMFMAGWARSYWVGDLVTVRTSERSFHEFAGGLGYFGWTRVTENGDFHFPHNYSNRSYIGFKRKAKVAPESDREIPYLARSSNFDDYTYRFVSWEIPYHSVVLPLTLLSAFLLLSKPRVANLPGSTKPPDEAQVTDA